jgi:hypothetical protein
MGFLKYNYHNLGFININDTFIFECVCFHNWSQLLYIFLE